MPALLDRLAARRRAARARDRYTAFVEGVEPDLAGRPRVHRFAVPPVIGDADARSEPIAVCIEPDGDAAATRASLERQTVAPASVLEGMAADALPGMRAERVLLLAAGDALPPQALERLGQAAALAPDAALITFDEDRLDADGERRDPVIRPGPSPDALAERDVAGSAFVVAREVALPAGVDDERHALARALAGSGGAGQAHVPLVLRHAARRPSLPVPTTVRGALGREPAVEVIVCFRDRPDLLRRSVRSLLDVTAWDRLRVRLVDNGSESPATARLVEELAREDRVIASRDERPFNFAALNNAAAAASDADALVFLNNDTEVVEEGWLEALLEHALRPEVGAVAPLLLRPDGRVQHAGAALGLQGYAGHPFAGLAPQRLTPFGAAADGTRNWLAVTAACLVVERGKFAAVGGFDESFTVAGQDVDLGLRLTAAGRRSLCVAHARVVHDESASRDPQDIPDGDFVRSRERYGAFRTEGDPFYSPALTLAATDCALRAPGEASAA
ncbi:MAG: O-antigen biosynthesis protein [Solirubrobacteraceae bacterium]|nr:O-antigen biosynthesis protein [Solirubrobacteraceae bacterium]